MPETRKQVEAIPASYPTVTPYPHTNFDDVLVEDAVLDAALIWQRLESWMAYRWGVREVVWTVEGEGEWTPPLTPATVTAAQVWEIGGWVSVTLTDGPYGLCLAGDGPYRITANVGSAETPPEAVQEAWRRLHEYSRGVAEQWRAGTAIHETPGDFGSTAVRGWAAKAIHLSGAGDLLRPYRRA